MGDAAGDSGTENDSDELHGVPVTQDPGGLRVEDATTGKADDVVKEAQRSVKGAVLVVDLGINVVEVSGGE